MSTPLPDFRPRRREVPWRALDTEALVVDVDSGRLYPLNSVATRIWTLCDGARSLDDIARAVVEEFDADEATIRQDVAQFVAQLRAAGLVDAGEEG